jgi:hypothetical protein
MISKVDERSVRTSTKKDGRNVEDSNEKEPQKTPGRNVLSAYVARVYYFKEEDIILCT